MPIYEYKREDGSTFEMFQSMSEDALTVCPSSGQPVKRIISGGTGLVFKGSGFYVTDYKQNGSKNDAGKTTESTSGESKSSADKKASSGSKSKSTEND